jgi:hypothetical protein
MKNMLCKISAPLFTVLLLMTSCNKSFFDGVPEDQYTVGSFYKNPTQVSLATGALYGKPWFHFNCQYSMGIGDTYSGNSKGDADADMVQFENMNITQSNQYIYKGWASLFTVVAAANSVIVNVQANAGNLDAATVNTAIGEARFMRAMAYFNLVRLYGAVPIIEDITKDIDNYQLPRHLVADVYRFIIADLQEAENKLPATKAAPARVTSGSAKALLAKVYLTQKDFTKAAAKALELINMENVYGIGLMDNYADLFMTANNNNRESLFALQWVASNAEGSYGTGNVTQAYCAAYGQGLTGNTDGWGTFRPTVDLQNEFETGDDRRKPTFMVRDDVYPELKKAAGGYTYPGNGLSTTDASVKKYVVGTFEDNASSGGAYFMSTGINTYMIRYSDVLLTYAEAVLGNNATTTDAGALFQFNRVRRRAKLLEKTSLTLTDIMHERRVEFAFEGQYWFDLLRLPQAQAISIISNQERGRKSNTGVITSFKVTPTAANFLLPIPQSDIDNNPKLAETPVAYY